MPSMNDHERRPIFHTIGVRSPACKKIAFAVKRRYDWSHWREIDFGGVVEKTEVRDGPLRRLSGDDRRLKKFNIGT